MMKQEYLEPEMILVLFDTKDVITTSDLWDEDLEEDELPPVPAL